MGLETAWGLGSLGFEGSAGMLPNLELLEVVGQFADYTDAEFKACKVELKTTVLFARGGLIQSESRSCGC